MRLIEIDSGKYESESLKINHRDIEEIIAEIEKKAREDFANAFIEKANDRINVIYSDSDDYYLGLEKGYLYSIEIVDELLHEKNKNDKN